MATGAPLQQDERIADRFLPTGTAQKGLVVGGGIGELSRQAKVSFIFVAEYRGTESIVCLHCIMKEEKKIESQRRLGRVESLR